MMPHFHQLVQSPSRCVHSVPQCFAEVSPHTTVWVQLYQETGLRLQRHLGQRQLSEWKRMNKMNGCMTMTTIVQLRKRVTMNNHPMARKVNWMKQVMSCAPRVHWLVLKLVVSVNNSSPAVCMLNYIAAQLWSDSMLISPHERQWRNHRFMSLRLESSSIHFDAITATSHGFQPLHHWSAACPSMHWTCWNPLCALQRSKDGRL